MINDNGPFTHNKSYKYISTSVQFFFGQHYNGRYLGSSINYTIIQKGFSFYIYLPTVDYLITLQNTLDCALIRTGR